MSDLVIIDITKEISSETPVWPGDTPFHIETKMSLDNDDIVNLTTLTMSAHTATHTDAPYHVVANGRTMAEVDLNPYWGRAQVVSVTKTEGPLLPEEFTAFDLAQAPRLLVRTPLPNNPAPSFPKKFPYPSPALARYLRSEGIILYGTDAPSMDAFDSHDLPSHHAIIENGIAILEGLNLADAADGVYELSALPLKIAGGDGSPVRAALRRLS